MDYGSRKSPVLSLKVAKTPYEAFGIEYKNPERGPGFLSIEPKTLYFSARLLSPVVTQYKQSYLPRLFP